MIIKFRKTNPNATIPYYGDGRNGAMNLVATEIISETGYDITYGTGISMEIPESHIALIFPKPEIKDYTIRLSDSVGIVDSSNNSEIQCTFMKDKTFQADIKYQVGDVIAQLVVVSCPMVIFEEEQSIVNQAPSGNHFTLDGNLGV